MSTPIRRTSIVALSAMALALLAPASVQAQSGPGPRWLGWLGCWSAAPADRSAQAGPDAPRTVCITPTRDLEVVEISAIADGNIVSHDRIDASGRPQAIDGAACKGTQAARWSADGRRVFLTSSVACSGIQTEVSALLAMTRDGTWIDVRRVAAGEGFDVRVARYRDVGIPSSVPAEIASALNTRGNFITTDARIDAGMPVGPNAMIEMSRALDAAVVEAFVMESGQRFAVDARALTEMADAGVPARITDAMIAVTNAADLADRGPSKVYYSPFGWNDYGHYGRGSADAWNQGTSSRFTVNVYTYDPWGFGFWPYGGYRFGNVPFGYGNRYGRGDFFGVGFGYPYFYGNYGSYSSNNPRNRVGYYYPPVIVLHNDPTNTAPRGRSVKGEGYTPDVRQAGTQPRGAHPRTDGVAGAIVEAIRTARPDSKPEPRRSEPAPAERKAEPRTEAKSEPRTESRGSAPRTAKGRP